MLDDNCTVLLYGPRYVLLVCIFTCVYPKNIALEQVVTHIVGHVDTVWDTKQVSK